MPIPMQGNWNVSVKSKNAAFPQRFIISGAAHGNGTYAGDVSTPAVAVTGANWTITIQNNPGSGFVNSADQIKFPVQSGGQIRFDIESNDAGPDKDFNDLILTCSTPASAFDYVIYGSVSSYSDACIFNPCFPLYSVIDSSAALAAALQRPILRKPIEALYPEIVLKRPPLPDPPPYFTPIVLPLLADQNIPDRQEIVANLEVSEGGKLTAVRSAAAAPAAEKSTSLAKSALTVDKVAVGKLVDNLRLRCRTTALPGHALRFLEYDRTTAELAGGAYTGTGPRETLGSTFTDSRGNYIFRYSRNVTDIVTEAINDTASGENALVTFRPDIIVQLLDPTAPGGIQYESAPYWNTLNFKRINICVPESVAPVTPVCNAGTIIQRVGDITIGTHQLDGSRTTSTTFLGAEGRITSYSFLGPQVRCAAWSGTLYLYGCLSDPQIKFYTIRYKRNTAGSWNFASEDLFVPEWTPMFGIIESKVGSTTRSLVVDGSSQNVPSYDNIENDSTRFWTASWKNLKLKITSAIYEAASGGPGPVQFRLEGYRADGTKVAAADDIVTLFIDNRGADVFLNPNITMVNPDDPGNPITQGNCALFQVPAGHPDAPLKVRFRANHPGGFVQDYTLSMDKGATGGFALSQPVGDPPPYRTRAYTHGGDLACNEFYGTIDDPVYDFGANTVEVTLLPASGRWLEVGQPFCAFSVILNGSLRTTNGESAYPPFYGGQVLIGIQA